MAGRGLGAAGAVPGCGVVGAAPGAGAASARPLEVRPWRRAVWAWPGLGWWWVCF